MKVFFLNSKTNQVMLVAMRVRDVPFDDPNLNGLERISDEDDLRPMTMERILDIHNKAAERAGYEPVSNLGKKGEACKQTIDMLRYMGRHAEEANLEVLPSLSREEAAEHRRNARSKNPKWKQSGKWKDKPGPSDPEYPPTAKIKRLLKKNPHQEGKRSYNRFERMKDGMTVRAYLKQQFARSWDLYWGMKNGEIKLIGYDPVKAKEERKAKKRAERKAAREAAKKG